MSKKSTSNNSIRRSIARGGRAAGTNANVSHSADTLNRARKSTKGHYQTEFTKVYERMTERDITLREIYGKDLLSEYIGVPSYMVRLEPKRTGGQTLTARDEVFYVKVGKEVYGKLSIRTQRLWKSSMLMFVYQKKAVKSQTASPAYSRKLTFKKATKSQKQQQNRKSHQRMKNKAKN